MNGAESIIRTLIGGGVNTCFMNPGTSEIHFVSALDSIRGMHSVLCLFEGVATGCADGYARVTGKPAAALLHLGPGLGNGIANLHNAKKAYTPMVNLVGQHATSHLEYDAPLTADIEALARPVSHWVRTTRNARTAAADASEAIVAARTPPGQIATLILPSDANWDPAEGPVSTPSPPKPSALPPERISAVAKLLRQRENTVLLLGDLAMRDERLSGLASRIAKKSGARLIGNWYGSRISRGAGRPVFERLHYSVDQSIRVLRGTRHLVLVGAKEPVGFFAYPNKPSLLAPPEAKMHLLVDVHEDIEAALEALAEALGASGVSPDLAPLRRPRLPKGDLSPETIWTTVAALMPENAIISDEAITAGRMAGPLTQTAPPHDWLHVTGGSIGQGLPVGTGAAIGDPDRQVIVMEGDGSGMYTLQSLWTQARESLNVLTVIFANRTYRILEYEIRNLCGKEAGPESSAMMRLDDPDLDWVALSKGMGVPARRVATLEAFIDAFRRGIEEPGPYLIEVLI